MARDYFTRAEFDLAYPSHGYSGAQVDAAQAEVIDNLEKWAGSAWPNVTGADGDGTAAAARSVVEKFDGPTRRILLRVPTIAISAFTNDGVAVASTDYWSDLQAGILGFGNPIGIKPQVLSVTYTYGHTSTPWAIKGPVMQATKSLLDAKSPGKGSKIPPRTRSYTTEGTTFEFSDQSDDDLSPWSWDPISSDRVRNYWGPDRPRIMVGAI